MRERFVLNTRRSVVSTSCVASARALSINQIQLAQFEVGAQSRVPSAGLTTPLVCESNRRVLNGGMAEKTSLVCY